MRELQRSPPSVGTGVPGSDPASTAGGRGIPEPPQGNRDSGLGSFTSSTPSTNSTTTSSTNRAANAGSNDDPQNRQGRLSDSTECEAPGTALAFTTPRERQRQHQGVYARQLNAFQQLSVLSWNVAKSNTNTALAQAKPRGFDVIALQEPWLNQSTKSPHCPSRGHYRCVYGSGRAAILVHKRHERSTWKEAVGED
ncbi:MAG: hypothetical protein SEPTF4163_003466 [Sporothrix epigloea]